METQNFTSFHNFDIYNLKFTFPFKKKALITKTHMEIWHNYLRFDAILFVIMSQNSTRLLGRFILGQSLFGMNERIYNFYNVLTNLKY